jgi:aryl-alcohol dehydrogenase-like predicted oxidoreductase
MIKQLGESLVLICVYAFSIRKQLGESLARLGTDYVDLYYQHRVDSSTPMETVMGVLKELHAEGKIRYAGLSEMTPDELRKAHAVFPVSAVQLEYSLQTRDIEATVLPVARELGIGLVAYSPLGRGLLSQTFKTVEDLPEHDWRRTLPRFSGEAFAKNAAKAENLHKIAERKGCTTAQLAIAWVLRKGADIVPIPGTKSVARVAENLGAAAVAEALTDADIAEIEANVPEAEEERYAGMWGTFNLRL